MRVFIVHAHAEKKSFNAALTATAVEALQAAGHEVTVSDLYAMKFDPVSDRRNFTTVHDPDFFKQQAEEMHATEHDGFSADIKAELAKLDWCDALILQFPLWWFNMPAIMKGWADRVLAMGRVYGGGKWYDQGAFRGKRAMCSVTMGGPAPAYLPDGLMGDIHQILFPINHGILRFTGFDVVRPFLVHGPARISQEERVAHLERYRQVVLDLPNQPLIAYPGLADYDESFRLRVATAAGPHTVG